MSTFPRPRMLAVFAAGFLAGCATQPGNGPRYAELPPAATAAFARDSQAAFTRIMDQYPEASGLALLDARRRGFVIYRDGSADYVAFGATSGLTTPTRVESSNGNETCFAPATSWSGACITVVESANGTLGAQGSFGNGSEFDFTPSALLVLPPVS